MITLYLGNVICLDTIVEMFDTVTEFKEYIRRYLVDFERHSDNPTGIYDENKRIVPFETQLQIYSELNADVQIEIT